MSLTANVPTEPPEHLVPNTFGAFKPVGWIMVGLPTQAQADALTAALLAAGWPADTVQHFIARESREELEAMVEHAGPLAGFGHEIVLLRRYADLANQGYRWLLLKADGTDQAQAAADTARQAGATLAVHYRLLTVEELI